MKVVIVGPVWPYRGGISHHTAVIAEMLHNGEVDVKVFSFRRQYPIWLYPGQTDKDNSKKPLRFDARYSLDPFDILSWWKTIREIRDEKPDVVAVQWWTTFWGFPYGVITRILKRFGLKVVYLIHNVIPHEQRIWDLWLAKFALSTTRDFIVHSNLEKKSLLKILPESNVMVSSIPVYTFTADEKITKTNARQKLGLNENQPWLLFFGFVRPYKGLTVLLEALEKLKEEGIRVNLLIAGEFWYDKGSYLDLILKLGLTDHIQIMDRYIPNEEVTVIFSAADVLVMPYLEGATQSGIASMALGYGLPVIMSEIVAQGISDQNRNRIRVVKTGDVGSLTTELKYFLTGGEFWKSLSHDENESQKTVDLINQLQSVILEMKEI